MTRKTYCGNLLWQSGLTLLVHDVRQTGLGGASCGPGPMAKYRFDPKAPVEWTLKIERIGK